MIQKTLIEYDSGDVIGDTDGTACPTCGRDDFKNTHGMRIHHAQAHGEKLGIITKVCEICGDEYDTIRIRADNSKYCSNDCKHEGRKRGRITKQCEICDTPFEVPPSLSDKRFCSDQCRADWMRGRSGKETPRWKGGGVDLLCEVCGNTFTVDDNEADRRRFCSRDCRAEHWRRRPKSEHPRYEGICSPRYYEVIRDWLTDEPWDTARKRIVEENDGCAVCGTEVSFNGYAIDVHHIVPITAGGANADELLMPLCREHHHKAELYTKSIPEVETLFSAEPLDEKILDLDTPIPSPDGWMTMELVEVGDRVFDENGEICTITRTTDIQHGRPCYEVVFDDGCTIVADANHEWFTWDRPARRSHKRAKNPSKHPEVRTTEAIKNTLTVDRTDGKFEANHRVPVAKSFVGEPTDLPIEPYTLGAWLGDGSTEGALIHTADVEIIEHIRDDGYPVKKNSSEYEYSISDGIKNSHKTTSFRHDLRDASVLGDKHIPEQYFTASESARLALFRGLMDTDGTCDSAGWCEYTGTTRKLVRGVRRLCSTLGIRSRFHIGDAQINGEVVGTKYRIKFRTDRLVFRLDRKSERQRTAPEQNGAGMRSIKEVAPVDSVPGRCIEVDSPSGLYLAGETAIPTP